MLLLSFCGLGDDRDGSDDEFILEFCLLGLGTVDDFDSTWVGKTVFVLPWYFLLSGVIDGDLIEVELEYGTVFFFLFFLGFTDDNDDADDGVDLLGGIVDSTYPGLDSVCCPPLKTRCFLICLRNDSVDEENGIDFSIQHCFGLKELFACCCNIWLNICP